MNSLWYIVYIYEKTNWKTIITQNTNYVHSKQ